MKISNYKQLRKVSKKILEEKKQATARQISTQIMDDYKISHNLNTSPVKISSYLKTYPKIKDKRRNVFIYKYD